MLDTKWPRPPGDTGNAHTWPFPVIYKVVPGASARVVIHEQGKGLGPAFLDAATELVKEGADGITTTGGFLSIFQEQLAAHVKVPVASSSLMQIPLVQRLLPPGKRVGVLSVHGDRVCRRLVRDGSPSRILMLTAAADVEDRVDGLELGADDYLGKPFAFPELIARTRALGRRGPGSPAVVQRGDLVVDRARHRASRAGVPLTLTRKEFGVLEYLAGADGAAVSAEELLEHVWDAHADPFSNTVAVTVGRLRRKLGDPPLIETVVGVGYRL